jgi:hypothetical protein
MVAKLVLDRARPYQARRAAGHGAARFLNARAVPGLFFWPGGPTLQKISWSMKVNFRHGSSKFRHKMTSMTKFENVM